MGSSLRLSRSIVRAALLTALAGAWAPGTRGATGPVPAPVLTGPSEVQAGESYALSWSNVFTVPTASSVNYYVVERALDAGFTSGLDQTTTQRSAITLTPGAAGATVLYHRILVKSSCPTASAVAIVSNVVAVPVDTVCNVPPSVGELSVSPPSPPAYSIWVITWNTLGSGPGPGGGPTGLSFRIRQTSAASANANEWVVVGGASSFTGGPGDYVYQVRAEASCGSVGPWSPAVRVTVGGVLSTTLQLVSEPAPIAVLVPAAGTRPPPSFVARGGGDEPTPRHPHPAPPPLPLGAEPAPIAVLVPAAGTRPTTSFVVRNGGNAPILVRAKPDDSGFVVVPDSFTLAPNAVQTVGVTSLYVTALLRPVHASVLLTAGDSTLLVPIDCMITAAPSAAKVVGRAPAAAGARNGDPMLRSILNPSDQAASFVATIRAPWIAVVSLDGQPWDGPLAANESRTVQLTVDRAKRRAGTGTEVGAIALATLGFADSPETLLVTDDGPALPPAATGAGAISATAARTRILYAAFPNAIDARSVGGFAAGLWVPNTHAVDPVGVSLLFNPVGAPGDGSLLRRFDLTLAAGETRRYRNVVATLVGVEGAFTAEVRSAAPTVTATALVNNRPLPATVAARNASRRTLAGTTPPIGQYGFELRPTIPGEGVKQSAPFYWVSGLAHDVDRRSNLLLLETSGYDTKILIDLFDANGFPVLKSGAPVSLVQTIPANATVQLFDDVDLFDPAPLADSYAYARFTWQDNSAADPVGGKLGSVVGMATVIDNHTQDASLHVGVTTNGLQALPGLGSSAATGASAARFSLSSLPDGGYPPPLSFPAVHAGGAPLDDGSQPFWRTRLTLTNTASSTHFLRLKYVDVNLNAIDRK